MGKKRVIKQTAEQALQEEEKLARVQDKARTKGAKRQVIRGKAYISSSYNNTTVTLADPHGNVIAWASAGAVGFRGPKKATPYAATRVVEILADKVQKSGLREVDVLVRGVGSGREAAIRALAANGIEVISIKDITPIPHNGPRRRKPRRV